MAIDIKLLNFGIGSCARLHGIMSNLKRSIVFIKIHGFGISLELLGNMVAVLGIIFRNKDFGTRKVKDSISILVK